MMLLRFLRLVPAESHSVFALTLTVGALCGALRSGFTSVIAAENRFMIRFSNIPRPAFDGLIC